MQRMYCLYGLAVSLLLSLQPSFRLSCYILRFLGNEVDKNVSIHNGVRFIVPHRLNIGANSTINSNCILDSRKSIFIGKNTMIGRSVKIFTLGHDVMSNDFCSVGERVVIGDNVVVFPYSIIMPGIKIGNNAVVYPGSVVTKDVPDNHVVGGNPAKHIKIRSITPSYLLDYKMYFGV